MSIVPCQWDGVDLPWPSERKWFRGTVAILEKASGGRKIPCLIQYDDGDRKFHDMAAFRWEIASDDEMMMNEMEIDDGVVEEKEEEEEEDQKGIDSSHVNRSSIVSTNESIDYCTARQNRSLS